MVEQAVAVAARCWENLKQQALDKLRTGHRASGATEGYNSTPWERAQFLAIDAWQPRNGLERQLIDEMAQAQAAELFWMARLSLRSSLEVMSEVREVAERAKWLPPRLSDAEAVEQAASMVERFHRMFLRALQVLQGLRRCPPVVNVQNAAQINVGQQQVNVVDT